MRYTIYLVTCTVTGKYYVGQTMRPLKVRWRVHCNAARKGVITHFYNAIRKYGSEAFIIESLVDGLPTKTAADLMEKVWIVALNARDREYGYNTTSGGDDPPSHKGVTRSKETRRKMAESKRGSKNSQFGKIPKNTYTIENNPNHGKSHSPEVIEKMREAQRKRWADPNSYTRIRSCTCSRTGQQTGLPKSRNPCQNKCRHYR
jgi:group I intron endonuclease